MENFLLVDIFMASSESDRDEDNEKRKVSNVPATFEKYTASAAPRSSRPVSTGYLGQSPFSYFTAGNLPSVTSKVHFSLITIITVTYTAILVRCAIMKMLMSAARTGLIKL